jgi:hypothetical protein
MANHLYFAILNLMTHIILLLFVATKNAYFTEMVGIQESFKDGVPEGACASCDEEGFVF